MSIHEHDRQAEAFDARLRDLHAQAVAATPTNIRLQLRPRRVATARNGWSMAAAFAMALVALGLFWPSRPAGDDAGPRTAMTSPAGTAMTAAGNAEEASSGASVYDEAYAALDEAPDFYLWLESSDASALLDAGFPGSDALRGDAVTE